MQSNGCPLQKWFLHIVFPPSHPHIQPCNLPPARPFSLLLCINRGGDPFSLGDTLRGWAHLSALSYLCSQLLVLLSMAQSPLQTVLSGNTFHVPLGRTGGEAAPAQGPSTMAPTALTLAASFGLSPTELQVLLTKQAEISPGYSWRGLTKCTSNKGKRWSSFTGASSWAITTAIQGPLSREADSHPSWALRHRSTSTEIQVKGFGFCQKPVGSWFLPRDCCAGLKVFDFCLFYTVFQEDLRRAESQGSPARSWCSRHKSKQGRKKKFGCRN